MKHIFSVHSPITYLVSLATIETLSLPGDNVLFICDGFYPPDQRFVMKDLSAYFSNKSKLGSLVAGVRYFNKAALIDRMIAEFVGEADFVAYVPVMRFVEKVIATHRRCRHFNFIEEGLAHYYREETLNVLTIEYTRLPWRGLGSFKQFLTFVLSTMRGYNFKLRSLPFSYSCYTHLNNVNYYGITEDAFPLVLPEKKKMVKLPALVPANDRRFDFNDSVIWIGDNGVDYYGYSKETYFAGIESGLIAYLKSNDNRKVFVKFHRGESAQVRNEQLELFKRYNIDVNVIPDSVIMELPLAEARNVVVCGVYSSLLYYTGALGHKTFTIYPLIEQVYGANIKGRNLDFYWRKVTDITKEI